MIVSNNGAKFTSFAILAWSKHHKVVWHCITPDESMQTAMSRFFHDRMREECSTKAFSCVFDPARSTIADWAEDYNTFRPHSSLECQTLGCLSRTIAATRSHAAQSES